jgi:hypothetical protein
VLDAKTRTEPFYYEASNENDFVEHTIKALQNYDTNYDMGPVVSQFCETYTKEKLVRELEYFFTERKNIPFEREHLILKDLDFRLGRHHQISLGSNKIEMDFNELLKTLANNRNFESRSRFVNAQDFEIEISKNKI